jgi:hypothetical protein
MNKNRFNNWEYPEMEEGKLTKYNWMVQHKKYLKLGFKTDIGAFTYINAKYGVIIVESNSGGGTMTWGRSPGSEFIQKVTVDECVIIYNHNRNC